ncbi:lysylphosphatidylglycerol synthase transmembrane domain-containing protein [Endomicrobium proavitum]|uniref:Uncharacterized protein n=1 Tax=Endomicrobium proavitum TaxID=1408281 RepID=A0A0G3WGP0_9BACT|nr:lysylphosphatidylglycerol synthase transmembrane domain-containing protein [Endomicrobium proavitum]AKL97846.1 membrane protein of unknown function [Endomicrobium proavitum]
MLKKHFFKILAGVIISSALIYLTFRNIDFTATFDTIKKANCVLLLLAAALYAFTYILRSIRYYFMILPIKQTRVFENLPYTILGFFMNNIIPLRIGELVRAKITGERLKISRSSILATIVVERLFDIIIFVASFFVIMLVMPFPEIIKKSFYVCAVVFGIGLVILFLITKHEKKALQLVSKLPLPHRIKNLVSELFDKFTGGLATLKKPSAFLISFLMSALIWLTESAVLVIAAYAFGINLPHVILGGLFTVIIIGIGAIVPTAPGYIGAFEYFGSNLALIQGLSIEASKAVACILTYHFIQIGVIFILGSASIVKTKISFNDLFKFAKIEDNKNEKE